ncbi:acyl-CoA dehydrogenase family protein [bacterium]|nr:acyl-CoA dehydrogenase family protein [bacterium]
MSAPNPIPPVDRGSYFEREGLLSRHLARRLAPEDLAWARPRLEAMGRACGEEVQELAWIADRRSPEHVPFDARGERLDLVRYDVSYRRMEEIAYGSGAVALKYDEKNRKEHPLALHAASFGLGFLFGMAECGLFCPLCMTDGAARVLERAGGFEADVRALSFLDTRARCTGAMFLTEKQGGSDVGASTTRAARDGDSWRLTGEKWFCSNVDAERALVLARPDGAPAGTRGLGLFLLRKDEKDRAATVSIRRLKEKLGVRSMPTGEVELQGARAHLVGPVDAGFKQMAEMLNLSRLYNAIGSAAICARSAIEAWSYATQRKSFGRAVSDHALARETLLELDAERAGALLLTFEGVHALDRADAAERAGRRDEAARRLLRGLTPLVKLFTAKVAVACASEAIEMHGGNGYIEDGSLPRLLRDAQVLPIWEGTTNVLVLDLARAARAEGAHEALLERASRALEGSTLAALSDARDRTSRLLGRARSGLADLARGEGDVPRGARALADNLARSLETALVLEAAEREGPDSPEADAAARLSLKGRAPSL